MPSRTDKRETDDVQTRPTITAGGAHTSVLRVRATIAMINFIFERETRLFTIDRFVCTLIVTARLFSKTRFMLRRKLSIGNGGTNFERRDVRQQ